MSETLINKIDFDENISLNPFVNMQILMRNSTFVLLSWVLFCTYFSAQGEFETLRFYSFDVLNFNFNDLSIL